MSDPPISSIVLDAKKGGYELGEKIQKVVDKKKLNPFEITINPLRIELRKSTEKYNVNDKYILEVVQFVESHFRTKNITMQQLIDFYFFVLL